MTRWKTKVRGLLVEATQNMAGGNEKEVWVIGCSASCANDDRLYSQAAYGTPYASQR